MKTKIYKAFLIMIVVGFFLSVNIVIAKDDLNGQPFKAIWQAIESLQAKIVNLQEQIDNIELLPGPQGPQGEQGEPGEQGPIGEQGPAGTPSWDEARITALEARVTALETPSIPPAPITSIVFDDFNSYANGSILGQGGWVEYANM